MSKDGPPRPDRKVARAQRLAEALRDNLKRRKAVRSDSAPGSPGEAEPSEKPGR